MADTAEQSVSLRDDLSKIYDQQAAETESTEAPEVEAAQEEPKGRARDEAGRFVKAEGGDAETEQEEAPAEEQEEVTEAAEPEVKPEPAIEAPYHWSAEDKEAFSKIPNDAKEFVLRRYKAMEADHTRKTQEAAVSKRFKDDVNQLLTPYRHMLGGDDVGSIRYMLGWLTSLQQNPAGTIHRLAQDYGIDLSQKPAENIDPNVQALLQKVNSLENTIAQDKQAQREQVSSSLLEQVIAFRDEKDSNGNLKHPHFEAVRQDMSVLTGSGRATSLDQAYELAVRLNPEIYDKLKEQSILDQQKAAKQKEIDDAKKKAAQAKKAASGIRSGGASVEKQGPQTLRDHLSAIYDKQAAS